MNNITNSWLKSVHRRRLSLIGKVMLILVCPPLLFFALPPILDRLVNRTFMKKPYTFSQAGMRLHETLAVADLHCDALLLNRDPLVRHRRGHVDFPRLLDGNVSLQVFAIPTHAPVRMGATWLPSDMDAVTALVIAQRWPVRTWRSRFERALFAAQRLNDAEARSQGVFRIIRTANELDAYLPARREHTRQMAGILCVEGLHCLENKLENLDILFDAGIRAAGIVHLADNELGGSAHGHAQGGLTAFGEKALRRMEALGMLVDLAHASPALISDVLDHAERPVLVSHTGLKGVYDNERNLSDGAALRIAESGGLIGIGYFPWAICGRSVSDIMKMIMYAVKLVGVEHVALGSDFDGMVGTPFDTSGLALITGALLEEGYAERDIAKIMGLNALRLLRETLPSEETTQATTVAAFETGLS